MVCPKFFVQIASNSFGNFYGAIYYTALYRRSNDSIVIYNCYDLGCSIYLVEGQLPSCAADNVPREFWNETRRSRKFENDLEKALSLSLNESAQPWIASNVFFYDF